MPGNLKVLETSDVWFKMLNASIPSCNSKWLQVMTSPRPHTPQGAGLKAALLEVHTLEKGSFALRIWKIWGVCSVIPARSGLEFCQYTLFGRMLCCLFRRAISADWCCHCNLPRRMLFRLSRCASLSPTTSKWLRQR